LTAGLLIVGLVVIDVVALNGFEPRTVSVWFVTIEIDCCPTCTVTSPAAHDTHTTWVPLAPAIKKPSVPRTAICEVAVTKR